MEKFKITKLAETGSCANCGEPSEIGDTIILHEDGYVYCSKSCAKENNHVATDEERSYGPQRGKR